MLDPHSPAVQRYEARERLIAVLYIVCLLFVWALWCRLRDRSAAQLDREYDAETPDPSDEDLVAQARRDADALVLELRRVAEARPQPTISYPPHPETIEFPKPRPAVVDAMRPHDQPPTQPSA